MERPEIFRQPITPLPACHAISAPARAGRVFRISPATPMTGTHASERRRGVRAARPPRLAASSAAPRAPAAGAGAPVAHAGPRHAPPASSNPNRAPLVDFEGIALSTLRKYKRAHQVSSRIVGDLASAITAHFAALPPPEDEQSVISAFSEAVRHHALGMRPHKVNTC